jgi:hypothetical protein
MSVSVTHPIGLAFNRVGVICFKAFELGKWFVIGFSAWVASLTQGGNLSFQMMDFGPGGPGGPGGPSPGAVVDWIEHHIAEIVMIGLLGLAIVIGVWALLMWLSSRGKLMFIDHIVRNQAAISEPWTRLGDLANRLFVFRLVLTLVLVAVPLLLAGLCLLIAWPDIASERVGSAGITAIVLGGVLGLVWLVAVPIVVFLVEDFVIPTMYLFNERPGAAWRRVISEVIAGRIGTIVRYTLLKIVFGMAAGAIALMGTILTCCLAALPYLGTVILLPVFIFMQVYNLHFLDQFGRRWKMFANTPQPLAG